MRTSGAFVLGAIMGAAVVWLWGREMEAYVEEKTRGVRTSQRRQSMKRSTKDKTKGKFHEVKGKVKEKVGRATNNPDLEAEGQVERIGGKVQKRIGQVEKVLGK
jgi:uncharacterized protein YjbJ (UPF0337 family)